MRSGDPDVLFEEQARHYESASEDQGAADNYTRPQRGKIRAWFSEDVATDSLMLSQIKPDMIHIKNVT